MAVSKSDIKSKKTDKLPFRVRTIADLMNMPDPEPRIKGIIDRGTVTMLSGKFATGKSFIALDWAGHIAAGEPWFSHPVHQGRVLYIAAEGAFGMRKRIVAWQRRHWDLGDGEFTVIIDPVQLADNAHFGAIQQVVYDFKIDFTVIDTLARCSVGLNENSSTEMGEFIANAYALRDAKGEGMTDVLIVHHSGYDTKHARGSTAIPADTDNSYQVESDDPHYEITLTTTKRKDGPPHEAMSLKLVEYADSCVVEEAEVGELDAPTMESLLRPDSGQTLAELAKGMGVTVETARNHARKLEDDRKARRELPASGKRNEGDLWYSQ